MALTSLIHFSFSSSTTNLIDFILLCITDFCILKMVWEYDK